MKLSKKSLKWIKEGRGTGSGSQYKPWLTVRDFSSQGRSHRVLGCITNRTHHFFSDLELALFLVLDWSGVADIREQYPLDIDKTIEIAKDKRIPHPAYAGTHQVMSTDFLIETSDARQCAIHVKYKKDFEDCRVIEKQEIEKKYWEHKGIAWKIFTEVDVPKTVLENIQWLYPVTTFSNYCVEELLDKSHFYNQQFKENQYLSIIELSKKVDLAYSLEMGESLLEIRTLMACRYIAFDVRIDYKALLTTDVVFQINMNQVVTQCIN